MLVIRRLIQIINLNTTSWKELVEECLNHISVERHNSSWIIYDLKLDRETYLKYGLKRTEGGYVFTSPKELETENK